MELLTLESLEIVVGLVLEAVLDCVLLQLSQSLSLKLKNDAVLQVELHTLNCISSLGNVLLIHCPCSHVVN